MSTDNGGPAFPVSEEEARGKVSGVYGGMTLRDYFAAKAMQSYITAHVSTGTEETTFDRLISKWAYETADAMLKARGEG